jgi:hypothetical protein
VADVAEVEEECTALPGERHIERRIAEEFVDEE